MSTAASIILQATHTHLYPGHRGKISGLARIADLRAGRDCLVEFADGSAATGRISRAGGKWLLQTSAYRTMAGANIVAKLWLIGIEENDAQVEFRILAKAAKNQA